MPLARALGLAAGTLVALPVWDGMPPAVQGLRLLVAAALLGFGLMPLAIWLAHRLGAVDRPGGRKLHAAPTPRLGGVAIVAAVNLTLFLNFSFSWQLKGVVLSGLMVAAISFLDDVQGVSAKVRLLVQTLAALILWAFDVRLEFLGTDALWARALEFFVFWLWMVGIVNAFNFLDGLNGLAASLAAAVCLLMGVLAAYTHQTYMLLILASVAGGALGFLPDNARYHKPARSFMGDVGSTYLGWMMAACAVMGAWSEEGPIKAYSAPLLIFSVMIFDMIYTTIARIARGDVRSFREWIEYVGRDHLHHRLLALGCSELEAVVVIVAIAVITGAAGIAVVKAPLFSVALILLQAVVFYLTLSFLMLRGRHADWR